MTKKNRMPFSAFSIEKQKEPARNASHSNAGGENKKETAVHKGGEMKEGRNQERSGERKRTKGSTYQYSKFGKGSSPRGGKGSFGARDGYKNQNGSEKIPPPEQGVIRIIPLGGVEEIGKNMTAIEMGDDIIVVDAGMQFKTDETPGIDYMIPNTTYLEERKEKIRAMIVTHGHLDHIGGIPIVMSRIGNPPLYSRNLSILLIQKRQTEFPHLPPLNLNVVENNSVVMAGQIKIRFFGVTHTVPDSMGIIIETPYGDIVTPGDYKLDQVG